MVLSQQRFSECCQTDPICWEFSFSQWIYKQETLDNQRSQQLLCWIHKVILLICTFSKYYLCLSVKGEKHWKGKTWLSYKERLGTTNLSLKKLRLTDFSFWYWERSSFVMMKKDPIFGASSKCGMGLSILDCLHGMCLFHSCFQNRFLKTALHHNGVWKNQNWIQIL